MVDIITDNIKPQIDAVGGGRKMTLQEDYDMGIDKGSFIYQENKDRYLKDKNVNVVMPKAAPAKETGEVVNDQKQEVPVPKKSQRVEFAEDTEVKPQIRTEGLVVDRDVSVAGSTTLPRGLATDPSVDKRTGLPTGSSIEKSAEQDLINAKSSISFDQFKSDLTNGVAIAELSEGNLERAKNALYISTLPNVDNRTKDRALQVLQNSHSSVDYMRSNRDSTDIAFARGNQVTTTEAAEKDPTLKSQQERYASGRIAISKIITGKFDNQFPNRKDQLRVEQAVIDRISTGNFLRTFTENFNEIARGITFDLPKLVGEAYIGKNIIFDAVEMGIGPAWEKSKPDRIKWAKDYKSLFNNLGGETLSDAFNDALYKEFKVQLDNGDINLERFKQLTEDQVTLPNGEVKVVPRLLVNTDLAYTMLSESIDQLSESEQFFMIFAENFPSMGGIIKEKGARAARSLKNLRKDVDSGIKKYSKENIEKIKKGYNKFDGMTLMETRALLQREGVEIKANDMLIKIALQNEKVSATVQRMITKKKELGEELSNLERNGVSKKSLAYKKVYAEYGSLRGKIFRNRVSLRTAPFAREALNVSLPASAVQYAFTAALSGEGENSVMDFYSAQALGAFVYAIGGGLVIDPVIRGTGGIISYLSNQAGDLTYTLAEALEGMGSILRIPKGFLLNKDVDAFDAFLRAERGQGLSGKERKAIGYIFKLGANLSEDNLELVVDSMKDYKKMEDAIVKAFPVNEQAKIAKSLRVSFGQASGLMWLQGLERSGFANIDIKDLKSLSGVNQIIDTQKVMEEQILIASRSLENLKEMLLARDGINLRKGESTDKLILGIESMISNAETNLVKTKGDLNSLVDDSLVKLLQDPDLDIDNAVHQVVLDASTRIRGDLKGELIVGSGIVQATDKIIEALRNRGKLIGDNRQSIKHTKRASLMLEDLLETLIINYKNKGKAAYKQLDKKMLDNNETIDMSSLLQNFKNQADPSTTLEKFFTKNGQFWSSTLNKKLRVSLNDVAERTLSNKFKDTTVDKLVKLARTEYIGKGKNKKINDYYISDNADELDVALWHTQNGELKAFDAVPSEIQDIYAAFRDYGYRQKDGSLGKLYADQAFEIDNLIKRQAPNYYEEHEKASSIYKSEIFDRQDGKGPLTDYLKSRSKRVTENTKDKTVSEDRFEGVYTNKTPSQIFAPIVNKIEAFIKVNGADSLLGSDIFDDFQAINKQLGDRTGTKPIFDLDTEAGLRNFETIKSAISENIYANWGRKQVMAIESIDPRAKIALNKAGGGYNFTKISETVLGELSELSSVQVRKNGVIVEAPLIDFVDMIVDQRDIVKQMGYHKELRLAYEIFKTNVNNKIKNVSSVVRDTMLLQDSAIQKLKELTKFKDPKSFFDNYVLNGTSESLASLRSDAIAKGIPAKDVDDAFKYLIINGLTAQSNMKPVAGKPLIAMDGTERVRHAMQSPGAIVSAMQKENVAEILDKFIDKDHQKFLMNMSDYLNRLDSASKSRLNVDGIVRPMGTNEMISRAFNLARGMVSPAYVAAEFAVRIASNAGIDMMKMAAGNKEAAEIMANLLLYPEKIKGVDMNKFKTLIVDFLATELPKQQYYDTGVPAFYYEETSVTTQ